MLSVVSTIVMIAQTPSPELVDVTEVRDNLRLWQDGHGHYVAGDGPEHLYYGDGKTFYQVGPYVTSQTGVAFEAVIRDPRYAHGNDPAIKTDDGEKLDVSCGKRHTTLTKTAADTAKAMIAKAVFKRRPFAMRAYALARDDHGVYYYVDRGRYEDNENIYRVFVGQRGAMQEMKLKNIVHDSAGDIFATATGDLRLIVGDAPATEWVQGDKHLKLVDLPVEDNGPMIYNELGIYKRFKVGTPCDDL